MKILATALLICASYLGLNAQVYLLGDKVISFTLTNATDNTKISLADYSQSKGVVVVFTNNSCPYSKLYESRILGLAAEFQSKDIRFILINALPNSQYPEDQPMGMASRAKQNSYPFPYLVDADGSISKKFGATKSPESFLLKNINGSFVLYYKGAIDDNPQTANDVSSFYLKDAVYSLLNNTPIKVSERRASGCMISVN